MNKIAVAFAALLLGSTAAQAVPLNFFTDNAKFTNTVGGSNVVTSQSGDDASVRWGVDVGDGQSRYSFNGLDGIVDVDPGETVLFEYGSFTHLNRAIGSGSGINSTVLNFDLTFLGETIPVALNINHTETPNTGGGCCDDIVSQTSTIDMLIAEGGFISSFSITPFVFFTTENAATTKRFFAEVTYRLREVPIPPAALLFAGGIAGIGLLSRKRKSKPVA